MKKTLAILLSLALLITAIPFATAMADTYSTTADFYNAENWTSSYVGNFSVGTDYVQQAAPQWTNIVATLTLKPNTTYEFSVDYATTWYTTGLQGGTSGFSIYKEGGDKATDTLVTGTTHTASQASGAVSTIFTTGTDTKYNFYFGFAGCQCPDHTAFGHSASNYKFTNFALTEIVPTDLENATEAIATKFTGTQYASIRAKDEDAGKAQGLRVRSDIDTSVLGDAALEDCTVVEYGTLVAKTENLGGAAMTIDMVGTEKKVVKGVAYNTSGTDVVYKLDGTTKSFTLVLINIPVERFVTSYSYRAYAIIEDAEGNQATVYGGATVPVSVESVATDIVNSGTATAEDKAAAQTALDEYAAYEATLPTYTTAADLAVATNWATSGTISQVDDATVGFKRWWTADMSAFTALSLKPNTKYTITAQYVAYDIDKQEIWNDHWGVAVVPGSKYTAESAAATTWSSTMIVADNIASGSTHNGAVWNQAKTITATFTTDATGDVVFGFRLKGNIGGWEGTYGIKMNNFAITEN